MEKAGTLAETASAIDLISLPTTFSFATVPQRHSSQNMRTTGFFTRLISSSFVELTYFSVSVNADRKSHSAVG